MIESHACFCSVVVITFASPNDRISKYTKKTFMEPNGDVLSTKTKNLNLFLLVTDRTRRQ